MKVEPPLGHPRDYSETGERAVIRRGLALAYGAICHGLFAIAVTSMVVVMGSGMSLGFGAIPAPVSWFVNLLLLLQFPLGHSLLLGARGRRILALLAPPAHARDLAPTAYVIVASAQVLLLFTCWSWSGVTWWQAEGVALFIMTTLYGASWGLLGLSILNSGPALQSGFNGWWAVFRGRRVRYPDLPQTGLYRLTRNPIYVSFALTTWTVPVWTPDQLMVALFLTAYCVLGPLHKERRLRAIHGERFETYAKSVPYWLPIPSRSRRSSS